MRASVETARLSLALVREADRENLIALERDLEVMCFLNGGRCRFTLEPETGPIRVRSGTEIETGASLSLNLSANFVALSGESGLLFDCGLPGFDDGV